MISRPSRSALPTVSIEGAGLGVLMPVDQRDGPRFHGVTDVFILIRRLRALLLEARAARQIGQGGFELVEGGVGVSFAIPFLFEVVLVPGVDIEVGKGAGIMGEEGGVLSERDAGINAGFHAPAANGAVLQGAHGGEIAEESQKDDKKKASGEGVSDAPRKASVFKIGPKNGLTL